MMVSIIMPIYNRSLLIEETLTSIKQQSYMNWECIIVDDHSTDATMSVVRSFIHSDTRFTLLKRPDAFKKGPSSCRNYGFSKSSGTLIQFFDSDDIMHPEHLQSKISHLGTNDLVVCKLKEFSGSFQGSNHDQESPKLTVPTSLFESFVTGAFPMMMVAPLWRKESINPYMPIREDLHILEDHELYARALYDSKSVAVVDEDLIFYRVGGDSSTNSFYKDIDRGIDSYFKAKTTVLNLSDKKEIRHAVLRMTMGFFRQALAERNFTAADRCLNFIKENELADGLSLKLRFLRVQFCYRIFKVVKKGDTKYKYLFKI